MTPDELTAIEARHIPRSTSNRDAVIVCHRDSRPWPCDTHEVLAALRTEQEARARLLAIADQWAHDDDPRARIVDDIRASLGLPVSVRVSYGRVAGTPLAPDASEGATE